ncbi:MAG: hypothetical protein LH606_14850 [Cytophagaceae bacterium]|nr:hypothetical protein [Cytophagaceae bacterium]
MLHYYYRSKERLFEVVFTNDVGHMAPHIIQLLVSEQPLLEKIRAFVSAYLDIIIEHPYIPGFIINELNRNEGDLLKTIKSKAQGFDQMSTFFRQVEHEIAQGRIRPVDPRHLLITMVSACVFPFIARPVIQMALQLDEAGFQTFIEERKQHVTDFLISGLVNK